MNDLKIFEYDGRLLTDSRCVSEMVGKEHSKLLRDIREYCKYLNESNFGLVDFFIESSYQDSKGENRPCYLCTKKGCDMIANKLTGKKGILFTAKYTTAFEQMREQLSDPRKLPLSGQISLVARGYEELGGKIEEISDKVDKIENDMPLFGCESDELSAHVKRKVVDLLGGKDSEAYKDKEVRSKLFRDIYNAICREFGLLYESGRPKSYKNLKRRYLYDAHEYVDGYQPPMYLREMIEEANAQMRMAV